MRPADTSPEAWKVYLEAQRRLTPGEKLQRILERSEMARRMTEAELRRKYPDAGDREIFLRRVRRELGPDLFLRVYGDALPERR